MFRRCPVVRGRDDSDDDDTTENELAVATIIINDNAEDAVIAAVTSASRGQRVDPDDTDREIWSSLNYYVLNERTDSIHQREAVFYRPTLSVKRSNPVAKEFCTFFWSVRRRAAESRRRRTSGSCRMNNRRRACFRRVAAVAAMTTGANTITPKYRRYGCASVRLLLR